MVAKLINVKFIHEILNSFIKRKKDTYQACPMNQIYAACVHEIAKYVHQACPMNENMLKICYGQQISHHPI